MIASLHLNRFETQLPYVEMARLTWRYFPWNLPLVNIYETVLKFAKVQIHISFPFMSHNI